MLESERLRRILVIRRDNIGDLVCTTPLIASLRKQCPNAQIGILVNTYNAAVLLGNPDVDRLFVYQKLKHATTLWEKIKGVVSRIRLLLILRVWEPSVTILAKSGYDRHGLRFARQFGAKNVVGFLPEDVSEKRLPDVGVDKRELDPGHEVEEISALLQAVGLKPGLGKLKAYPNCAMVNALTANLLPACTRIALHISARELERRWGLDNFISLTKHILETYQGTQVLLFWSPGKADDPYHPGDDEAATQLLKMVQSDRLIPMPTKTLMELMAGISICDVFIGTDGGAMHLAAAFDKKILALFENLPSKLNHWYPWGVQHMIVHGLTATQADVAFISQLQVKQALNALLRGQ